MVRFAVHPAAPAVPAPAAVTTAVIIPARYDSRRLPGKPLRDLGGRPLIEHVHRRAVRAAAPAQVIVATDDARIADAVRGFGGDVRLTRRDHPTGADRLAEVARSLTCEIVVNVQGDEPLVDPALIDRLIDALARQPRLDLVTARCPAADPAEAANPHLVKVVVDRRGDALYFSRAPIPARAPQPAGTDADDPPPPACNRHIGVYAYRRPVLLALADLAPTPLERTERLEQLRALEAGYRIGTVAVDAAPPGVDTPEDLERVRRLLAAGAAR